MFPAIAAHRGGAALWPENSMPAFRGAAALPIEFVEFDVHAARDGTPVVIHDATLDRTTRARGPVCGRTGAELNAVRLRGGDAGCLPRLADVLDILAGSPVRPRIEIKHDAAGVAYPGLAAAIVDDIAAAGFASDCVVTSFHLDTLRACRDAGSSAPMAWLRRKVDVSRARDFEAALATAVAHGMAELGLPHAMVTSARVAACAAAGLAVGTWTVDAPADLHRMFDSGVGVVITDDPVRALAIRAARARPGVA